MAELKSIKIQNLMLDVQNYRIGPQEGQPQAVRAMIDEQGHKLVVLAEDIITNGLSPIERFMATPAKGSKHQFIVIEGNRRVTAIKLVLNPDLAKGTELEKPFRHLHDEFAHAVPHEITDVVVVPSKKDSFLWIERRHDRGLKGAGVEDWSSSARDRADADRGKPTPAKDVRDFVLANAILTDNQRKKIASSKFNNTNLTRLLGTAHVRTALGLKSDGQALLSTMGPEWLLRVLTDMVVAIGEEVFDGKPFSEANIDKVEQREAFIDQIAQKYTKPSKPVSSWAVKGDQHVNIGTAAGAKPGQPSVKLTPATADRKFLIPKGFKVVLPSGKFANIFHELRELDVERFTNAVAVLFRVFIEFSTDHYIQQNKILLPLRKDGKPKDRLIDKLNALKGYLEANKILSDKQLKPLKDAIAKPHVAFSTDTFNSYVHDPTYSPKATELKLAWDDFQPLIEILWKPKIRLQP